ncbi:nitric oxide reductase activation protein NorD [Thermodesulfobacteriota bacterium]
MKSGLPIGQKALKERSVELLAEFQDPVRSLLQKLLEILARSDREAAWHCADQAETVLNPLRRSHQVALLKDAIDLTDNPRVAEAFFCRGAELVCRLREKDLSAFVAQGRAIGRINPDAAIAFFRLESQTGQSAFGKYRNTVHIGDVIGVLQLYCTAMAEKPLRFKSLGDALKKFGKENQQYPVTDGQTIFLPENLNRHIAYQTNFEEYKVLAAHQAGYIEFGTFDMDINRLRDHPGLSVLPWSRMNDFTVASHYGIFFHLFNDPWLARDIFFAIEDGRVDFLLERKYRGLAPLIERARHESLKERPNPVTLPPLEAGVEVLIQCSINRRLDNTFPDSWHPFAEKIMDTLSRTFTPRATVTESAAATVRIYEQISDLLDYHAEFVSVSDPFDDMVRTLYERKTRTPSTNPGRPSHDKNRYQKAQPVFYRGQTNPNQVQLELAVEMLHELKSKASVADEPLTTDILAKLVKKGAKITLHPMIAEMAGVSPGLILNNLDDPVLGRNEKPPFEENFRLADLHQRIQSGRSPELDPVKVHYYDEWDYLIGDYRPRWCTVREFVVKGESSDLVTRIKEERADLISVVRRNFQSIRPSMFRWIKRLPNGDEIDLDSAVERIIERRANMTFTDQIYKQRKRSVRDVATVFLLDLSASTRKSLRESPASFGTSLIDGSAGAFPESIPLAGIEKHSPLSSTNESKRVVDIEREALIVMAEALEGMGDEYAIYGFSSSGRDNVEFLIVKDFSEQYDERIRCRIGALKPRTSTRMGPAVRHAQTKLAQTGCRLKVLILLSDGYPQDYDYGPDLMGHEYGVHDTMVALREARRKNIYPFMVTVDLAGNDYLYDMCAGDNYLVVKRPSELPNILPKVYRGLTV